MSNAFAIATVTVTLRDFLQEQAVWTVPGAEVTTLRPQSLESRPADNARINLYLYQIVPNAALGTADLPTRRSDGALMQQPQSAWDLHYLISFSGNETTLEDQRLLGSTVDLLHAQPFLDRQKIRATISDSHNAYLARSNLAEQVESIKFAPLLLNLEELSKVWSVFFQTPYSLSIAYQASVVLIEADTVPHPVLPVRERQIYVTQLQHPVITSISPQLLTVGETLTLRGRNLRGEVTQLQFGEIGVNESAMEQLSDREIRVPLPAGLLAGINTVQVSHWVDFSQVGEPSGDRSESAAATPSELRRCFASNVAAFVLRPTIAKMNGSYEIQVLADRAAWEREFPTANPTDAGNRLTAPVQAPAIAVYLNPSVKRTQHIELLLNEIVDPLLERSARAYQFRHPALLLDEAVVAAAGSPSQVPMEQQMSHTLVFPIPRVAPGQYLTRVQVDRAESPLFVDVDRNSATFNQYIAPMVIIP